MEIDPKEKKLEPVCTGTIKIGEKYNGLLFTDKSCLLCDKSPRWDYDGLCMDCADEVGTSEIWDEKYEDDPLAKTIRNVATAARLKGNA
jgi:hypothetical protein